jgi:hypothetical protein
VLIDGRPLPAYVRAYVEGGRVFAPVAPVLTRLADRLWFEGNELVIQRGERRVRVRLGAELAGQLDTTYVPAGPTLRALGASVQYDASAHRLVVRLHAPATVTSPSPFNPAAPSSAPNDVFTPLPPATPRPVWTGSPLPRRTALPVPPPAIKAR